MHSHFSGSTSNKENAANNLRPSGSKASHYSRCNPSSFSSWVLKGSLKYLHSFMESLGTDSKGLRHTSLDISIRGPKFKASRRQAQPRSQRPLGTQALVSKIPGRDGRGGFPGESPW